MTDTPEDYPHLVKPQRPPVPPNCFTLSDLMTLIACGAAGLAISRCISWYAYRGLQTIDADWLFYYAFLPLAIGMANLGQLALFAMHVYTKRRDSELTPCEFPGIVTTCALGVLLFFEAFLPNSRAAGMMMVLGVLLTFALASGSAIIAVLRRLGAKEQLLWTEWLGVAATIPGGTLTYLFVSDFPMC